MNLQSQATGECEGWLAKVRDVCLLRLYKPQDLHWHLRGVTLLIYVPIIAPMLPLPMIRNRRQKTSIPFHDISWQATGLDGPLVLCSYDNQGEVTLPNVQVHRTSWTSEVGSKTLLSLLRPPPTTGDSRSILFCPLKVFWFAVMIISQW